MAHVLHRKGVSVWVGFRRSYGRHLCRNRSRKTAATWLRAPQSEWKLRFRRTPRRQSKSRFAGHLQLNCWSLIGTELLRHSIVAARSIHPIIRFMPNCYHRRRRFVATGAGGCRDPMAHGRTHGRRRHPAGERSRAAREARIDLDQLGVIHVFLQNSNATMIVSSPPRPEIRPLGLLDARLEQGIGALHTDVVGCGAAFCRRDRIIYSISMAQQDFGAAQAANPRMCVGEDCQSEAFSSR